MERLKGPVKAESKGTKAGSRFAPVGWRASEQAGRAGGLGGKEEHTRADESLATKLENKQLGVANNCMQSGSGEEETLSVKLPQTDKHLHFSLCRESAPASSASLPCVPPEGFSPAAADPDFHWEQQLSL